MCDGVAEAHPSVNGDAKWVACRIVISYALQFCFQGQLEMKAAPKKNSKGEKVPQSPKIYIAWSSLKATLVACLDGSLRHATTAGAATDNTAEVHYNYYVLLYCR
jgi:hypothetical protein